MFVPPPPPPWEGFHPLVIHFPIALLLVAPLFVFLGALFPVRGWWLRMTALILLALGTASAFVSVATGVAARDMVEEGPDEMWPVLEEHEALAEKARNVVASLTVVYGVLIGLSYTWKRVTTATFHIPLHLVFLVSLMAANLMLANAAHLGGRLVHQFGVRAVLGEPTPPISEPES